MVSSSTVSETCSASKRSTYEANPVNLDGHWTRVCAGVHRLEHELMVVLDVEKVLDFTQFGVTV